MILLGFHGQTIYHNPKEKISKPLGIHIFLNTIFLKIIFNFRINDIKMEGGSSFNTYFSSINCFKYKIFYLVCFLNIGGISNISIIREPKNL